MKLKTITILYILSIAIFVGVLYTDLNRFEKANVDTVEINENCRKIMQKLDDEMISQSTDGTIDASVIKALEEEFSCKILLKSYDNYGAALNTAIKNGKTIIDYETDGVIVGKFIFDSSNDIVAARISTQKKKLLLFTVVLVIITLSLFVMLYFSYVRPFKTLQKFSSNIAKGNLDFPLPMKKNNYFGIFTESFDIMREELRTARENEQRANQSKKELVAELSHDMKTPISTIKATCEVTNCKIDKYMAEHQNILTLKDKETYSEIRSKIEIIDQKTDMINQLISNMFHASLEELNNLQVEPVEAESTMILAAFEDLNYYGKIKIKNNIPECLVYMDLLRFNQVIDNIINNSYKYADTDIDVTFALEENRLMIEISDHGPGVPDKELPLLTEKFYRGSNKSGKSGSGLGLFLASFFMENMKGGLECFNNNGFVVRLFLKKV